MKILLVSLYFDPNAMAIRLLSSVLKKEFPGDEVYTLYLSHKGKPPRMDFDLETPGDLKAIQEFIARLSPDVVGISLMYNYFPRAVQLTRAIREVSGAIILWGGVHPTLNPEECTVHADLVFVGEAELALPAVIKKLRNGEPVTHMPGILYRENGGVTGYGSCPACEDLDSLPPPDYDFETQYVFSPDSHCVIPMRSEYISESRLAFYGGVPFHRLMTARGCSQACTYCINSRFRKILGVNKYIRQRSLESVMRELEYVAALGIFKRIMIIDDDFCLRSADWLQEFAQVYRQKIGLPFGCQATPGRITREKIQLIRDAGATFINMGVQTGSDTLNAEVFNRKLGRNHVLRAASILAEEAPRAGRGFDFLVRNPYESLADKIETARLVMELPLPFVVRPYALTFFPGLPLTERAYQDGLLTEGKVNSIYDYDGSDEENAWQEVLENAPHISDDNRTRLLTRLEETPPQSVGGLIAMLKEAGAEERKTDTPALNHSGKRDNQKLPASLEEQINGHYNAGASFLKDGNHEDAQSEFKRTLLLLDELGSSLDTSRTVIDGNRQKLTEGYIHVSVQLLECFHVSGNYREAHNLISKLLENRSLTLSEEYRKVFEKWLMKYNAVGAAPGP
ncbi:MAG: B12-binding domain-containing radical SAM protein [Nitrospiraceae bacterium]|nr:MAG: B12-binding domain-containing radical SAM protein [Nitrospiraceae bacterium]